MQHTTKEHLMSLYRDGFPEDSEDFVRYFFDHIYSEDNVITRCEDNEMISCAHIVDKRMKYYDNIATLPYLVAVSTLTAHRGKGKVEPVMREALERLETRHSPLVALYPFSHEYYTRYGFVTVDEEYSARKLSDIDGLLTRTDDIEALSDIYRRYEDMRDIAIHRDVEDMRARYEMLRVDAGEAYIIEKNDTICGYVMAYGENIEELVLIDNSISTIDYRETRDNVMMRVVDILEALRAMPFDSEESTRRQIRVHDSFMGDRLVLLDIFDGEIYTRYLDSPIYSIPTIDISVEDLTLYVMGRQNVLGLPKIDRSRIALVDKY